MWIPNLGVHSVCSPVILVHIFFHALVAAPASWFYEEEKAHVLYSVRFFLGLISTITESALVVALSRKYGKRLGCYTIAMLGLTSGSFFASTSFLPSSFSMTGNIYMHSSALSNCLLVQLW